ncbi:unnamed protein product [Schistosoma mattheei]|uniref:Oxidoreductase-like domain-containing protein n=1 Tax=Schistosoma mattheei TaxID=31246 RepID=A0A183NEK6_9TREM|nr:unnamed protein product [Schistosoma mattheei]
MGLLRKLNFNHSTICTVSNWLIRLWRRNYFPNSDSEPEPPHRSYCCESGCANCVWIEYAENLFKYHIKRIEESNDNIGIKDKDEVFGEIVNKLQKEINQIKDPNVRVFLLTEIAVKQEELLEALQKNT